MSPDDPKPAGAARDDDEIVVIADKPRVKTLVSPTVRPPPLPDPLELHIEALIGHAAELARRSYGSGRDFVDAITRRLEDAVGGPPNPTLWMLRELKRNPKVYLDRFNVLLMGKLAESVARQLNLLDEHGKVPRSLLHQAYDVCQSVARAENYRVLGMPPE